MTPTLISDNCICLSLDLSDSFNQMAQLQSQHAHKRLFTSASSLKNVRLVLHCFQGAVLITFDPLPALPGSCSAYVTWCIAKSHVCAVWQHELFKKLVILNDLDVRTSCVINRCNIPCAPPDMLICSEARPLTSAWLSCVSVSELKVCTEKAQHWYGTACSIYKTFFFSFNLSTFQPFLKLCWLQVMDIKAVWRSNPPALKHPAFMRARKIWKISTRTQCMFLQP